MVTCNYVAREFGVTKLMYIKDAKEKCPQLVLVSGEDLTNYRNVSNRISGECLQRGECTLFDFFINLVSISRNLTGPKNINIFYMQKPHSIPLSLKKNASEKVFFYIRIPQKVYTICRETGDG